MNSLFYNLKVKEKDFKLIIRFDIKKSIILGALNQFSKTIDLARINTTEGFSLPENSFPYFDKYLEKIIPQINNDLKQKNKNQNIHYYRTEFAGVQKKDDYTFSIQLQLIGLMK